MEYERYVKMYKELVAAGMDHNKAVVRAHEIVFLGLG